ncbi:MAG: DUF2764 family protein [Bacteroidales bacterium]|nr:DUF2764 family protein [Bacteroidales bacterium]
MNNYEYIVACLPVLRPEDSRSDSLDAAAIVEEIREQLSAGDAAVLDTLLAGYDPDRMDAGFYTEALRHKNRFIREWFAFDMELRNATVAYLNQSLGRPAGQDRILLEGREDEEFEDLPAVESVLRGSDILRRERGLDDLRWRKIEELTMMDYFDLDAILGFVARLKIIDRWLQLDPDSGRAFFRRLVDDIQSTYENKKQTIAI